jgi:hypothetical protein
MAHTFIVSKESNIVQTVDAKLINVKYGKIDIFYTDKKSIDLNRTYLTSVNNDRSNFLRQLSNLLLNCSIHLI